MALTLRARAAVRRIGPHAVGTAVWGSSLAFMIHGLWAGAWHGFTFVAIFAAFGGYIGILSYRTRTWAAAEMRRLVREASDGSEPASGA